MKTKLKVNAIRGIFEPANFLFAENDDLLEIELETPYSGEMILNFNHALFGFNDGRTVVPKKYFVEGTQTVKVMSATGREWLCENLVMSPFLVDEEQAHKVEQEAVFYKKYVKTLLERVEELEKQVRTLKAEEAETRAAFNKQQETIEGIISELNI